MARGCAWCAMLVAAAVQAEEWQRPPRFARPELTTDEGGLWAMMDRSETQLRRSPFLMRDAGLHKFVSDIACRLGGEHCSDIRVYVVRNPLFNANMAPNGMMQVWTGVLLRMENEAQIAAVLSHEIAHYLERHALERLRDTKSASAFGQFLSIFGAVGTLGQLAVLAGMFSYSREQELAADRIGVSLMSHAGYDAREAISVWRNLLAESKAKSGADAESAVPIFATHPDVEERLRVLRAITGESSNGTIGSEAWYTIANVFYSLWVEDEIARGQHDESIALFSRMIGNAPDRAALLTARGEVYRLRARNEDLDLAMADFQAASAIADAPAETYRGLGLIQRRRGQPGEAVQNFRRYLEMAPEAADAPMVRSYVEALRHE